MFSPIKHHQIILSQNLISIMYILTAVFELPNHGTAFNGSSPCPPQKKAERPYRELIFLEKLEIPRDSNVGSVDSWVSRLLG